MASADLRDELLCSICLSIYTDPVTLRCGHNFCQVCMDQVLNAQHESGIYSCPECREKTRPTLMGNMDLRNVIEHVLSSPPHQEEVTGICCTYCFHSPVPAVKSCLMCEASLCDDHLRVHSKGPEHVLTDPSTSLENPKCPVHKKILEYYCTEDAACICVTCRLDGKHRGHQVETLDEASEKKKKKMRDVLQTLTTKRKETEGRVQRLEERCRKAQEKASGEAERVTALCIELRSRLDDLEKRIRNEISRQEMEVSLSDMIQKLEIQKDELSRKMKNIEELCNMTDPLTVLQEPDTGGHDGGDEDTGGHDGGDEDTGGHDETHDVDVDVITGMLHAGISDIMTYLQTISPAKPKAEEIRPQPPRPRSLLGHTPDLPEYRSDDVIVRSGEAWRKEMFAEEIYGKFCADISLDINTAHNNLIISDDLKTVTRTRESQNRPDTAERFKDYSQVMSSRGFTSGRHYWDVEIRSLEWEVGMCYPSIDRRGRQSYIGGNNKSWSLIRFSGQYSVAHDSKRAAQCDNILSNRFRICLDYEAGELSFYELLNSVRHLHTFTTTFRLPLYVVLRVKKGGINIIRQ
ncbi:tripartite motif-containing protein 14-like isoform X2 [Engystomops pustulosus]|uniref:tripartite motif-containing protein 14-like isoform X2 n=1 Tax=Engystomops pustulosus TaxID=76066 RepID=UPI003AFA8A93